MMGEIDALDTASERAESCTERLQNILAMDGLCEERRSQAEQILADYEGYSKSAAAYYQVLASG